MRIISGKFKSRVVCAPKGKDVRPTTDRVREAMFSSVTSLFGNLEGACVLDAFAGSGALGFESVSRGAPLVFAFEKDRIIFKNLIKNAESLGLKNDEYKAFNADVELTKFQTINNKFDLLFFDPPYKTEPNTVLNILNHLNNANKISENAYVIYEHSSSCNFDNFKDVFQTNNFKWVNGKIYGDIAIDYMKFIGGNIE